MSNINYIGANELVFNKDNTGVYSGGFNVNSIMMKSGMSPIMTINSEQTGGNSNKVSDLFESLVIPNWVLSYNMNGGEYRYDSDSEASDEDIDDDLHDKLLGLVREHENVLKRKKHKQTKKQTLNTKKGGTRKHKK
jgi:hypothetical protein